MSATSTERTHDSHARSFAAVWLLTVLVAAAVVDWNDPASTEGWRYAVFVAAGVFQLIAYFALGGALLGAWRDRSAQPAVFRRTATWGGGVVVAALVVVAGPAVWVALQPTTVDPFVVESDIETQLAEEDFDATVDCPKNMTSEQGATSDCLATIDDGTEVRLG